MRLRQILILAMTTILCTTNIRAQVPDTVRKRAPIVKLIDSVLDNVTKRDSIEASSLPLIPFVTEIDSVAHKYHLPGSLLAAITQVESDFEEFATRSEPGYLRNRQVQRAARAWSKAHRGQPTYLTELHDRSRSFGLMQPMGELAREQGFTARYLGGMYLPLNSLEHGAILLRKLLKRYPRDTLSGISAYNQGNNRKHFGSFTNARYVYRVHIAWMAYRPIFIKRAQIKHDTEYGSFLPSPVRGWRVGWYSGHVPDSLRQHTNLDTLRADDGEHALASRYDSSARYAEAQPTDLAGGDGESAHWLRDTITGLLIAAGVTVYIAYGVLGHRAELKRLERERAGHAVHLP